MRPKPNTSALLEGKARETNRGALALASSPAKSALSCLQKTTGFPPEIASRKIPSFPASQSCCKKWPTDLFLSLYLCPPNRGFSRHDSDLRIPSVSRLSLVFGHMRWFGG